MLKLILKMFLSVFFFFFFNVSNLCRKSFLIFIDFFFFFVLIPSNIAFAFFSGVEKLSEKYFTKYKHVAVKMRQLDCVCVCVYNLSLDTSRYKLMRQPFKQNFNITFD